MTIIKPHSTCIFITKDNYPPLGQPFIDLRPVKDVELLGRIITGSQGQSVLVTLAMWYNLAFPNKTHYTKLLFIENGKVVGKYGDRI